VAPGPEARGGGGSRANVYDRGMPGIGVLGGAGQTRPCRGGYAPYGRTTTNGSRALFLVGSMGLMLRDGMEGHMH